MMTENPEQSTVLIVDDEPTNIQLIANWLKKDHHLKVATDASRCLEIAAETPLPDLILLDIEMPGMSGYEVCKRLKAEELTAGIPVIFVTGLDTDCDEEYGLSIGAVDYITKPVKPAIMRARVNTHVQLKQQRDLLLKMALHDQLTGLYNRHYLLTAAEQKLSYAQRHRRSMCILMIDVDHFKKINDQYGHPTGDKVLKTIAEIIGLESRKEDISARFGGEEFVVLLDSCMLEDGITKAEHLRELIATAKPDEIGVTVSIGLSYATETDRDFSSLLSKADQALYQAKANGRDRVVVYEESNSDAVLLS